MSNVAPVRTQLEIAAVINDAQYTLASLGLEIAQEEMQGIDQSNTLHRDKIYRLILIDVILFNILDQFGNILNYYQSTTNAIQFNKILTGLQSLSNSFSGPAIPLLMARNTAVSFVPTAGSSSVVGAMIYIGDYDASSNQFPTSGSGPSNAVAKGNMYTISVEGSPAGEDLPVGTTIMAKIDNPGQLLSNWRIWF